MCSTLPSLVIVLDTALLTYEARRLRVLGLLFIKISLCLLARSQVETNITAKEDSLDDHRSQDVLYMTQYPSLFRWEE